MTATNPSSLALTSIADGSSMTASPVRNNFSSAQTAVNALIAVLALATAKGDLLVATASGVYDHLVVGANSKVLVADSAQSVGVKWDYPSGYEYGRTLFTATVSVTATVEASATTVVTAPAVTFDGVTAALVEFYSPAVAKGTTNTLLYLFEDGVSVGIIGTSISSSQTLRVLVPLTPASGARTYSVRATVDAGTGSVVGGLGGAGNYRPGFIRVTKV